jgi:hypothetical protein
VAAKQKALSGSPKLGHTQECDAKRSHQQCTDCLGITSIGNAAACANRRCLQALRGIKNCVIGNKRQKLQYIQLGAVQLVVAVLASPTADAAQLVQAAAALGSFAANEDGLKAVLQHGGIPHLLRVLQSSEDVKVVEAAVRALKAVCRVGAA